MIKILILEDELELTNFLKEYYNSRGITAEVITNFNNFNAESYKDFTHAIIDGLYVKGNLLAKDLSMYGIKNIRFSGDENNDPEFSVYYQETLLKPFKINQLTKIIS
jgi:hypothetical protein